MQLKYTKFHKILHINEWVRGKKLSDKTRSGVNSDDDVTLSALKSIVMEELKGFCSWNNKRMFSYHNIAL